MQTDRTTNLTRRKFLRAAAAAGIGATVTSDALAQDPRVVLDVAILNYLLRVQYVQAEMYREGLSDFTTAARIRQFDAFGGQATLDTLRSMMEQENDQAAAMRDLVIRLGGSPLTDCVATFPRFATAADMMRTTLAMENIGVSAYLGVVPLLRIPQVQTAVASIASVQSRHAAYIGVLNGESPAPRAADTPSAREEVLDILDPYLGRCTSA